MSDDFYYENLNIEVSSENTTTTIFDSTGSSTIRITFALLLRAGYILVQLGSIPCENVYTILLQNIADIAVSTTSFGLVGFIFAFGKDGYGGFVGHGTWIVSSEAELDNAILGFSACLIGSAIITTNLSCRLHFVGYLTVSFIFSAFHLPFIMHWTWYDRGWMYQKVFMGEKVSLKDHAGGLIIHFTSGLVGLIGCIFLGRRLLRLKDIDESSIGAESPGSTLTGYLFIALGLVALALPTPFYEQIHTPRNFTGVILVNSIMAMSAGIIVTIALHFLIYHQTFNYWIILRCMQGAISGLITIAAGIDVYTSITAYLVGFFGSIIFYFVVLCIHNSSLEDYCNITATHLICGFFGTLMPPLFGSSENLGFAVSIFYRFLHLGWQCICCLLIGVLTVVVFVFVFFILTVTGFLRNKSEELNHRRGLVVSKRGPERWSFQRLFAVDKDTAYIEPGSVGKSPEQTYKFQGEHDLPYFKKTTEKDYKSKQYAIKPSIEDLEDVRKARFVYTVKEEVDYHQEKSAEAGGDVIGKIATSTSTKKVSSVNDPEKQKSKNSIRKKVIQRHRRNKMGKNMKTIAESILEDEFKCNRV